MRVVNERSHRLGHIENRDVRALPEERLRDSRTDAARATRNKHVLMRKVWIACRLNIVTQSSPIRR